MANETPFVRPGVEAPSSLNPRAVRRRIAVSPKALLDGLRSGDRVALARAITLIESTRPADRAAADWLLQECQSAGDGSLRVGWTGVPGAGKSTLIESLGVRLADDGNQLAVLAVDPSSTTTGGSILGDKSRMARLAVHPNAFIRPSPSSGALGGVAQRTREVITLCEAAGFDVIFVETVGVGQSEIAVRGMVDCFILMTLAGAGDELQGIKRGVIEAADLVVVNKCDGDRRTAAEVCAQQVRNALHLLAPRDAQWDPPVLMTSAMTGEGLDDLWETVLAFQCAHAGVWRDRRREQEAHRMRELVTEGLLARLEADPAFTAKRREWESRVRSGAVSARQAAEALLHEIQL